MKSDELLIEIYSELKNVIQHTNSAKIDNSTNEMLKDGREAREILTTQLKNIIQQYVIY